MYGLRSCEDCDEMPLIRFKSFRFDRIACWYSALPVPGKRTADGIRVLINGQYAEYSTRNSLNSDYNAIATSTEQPLWIFQIAFK